MITKLKTGASKVLDILHVSANLMARISLLMACVHWQDGHMVKAGAWLIMSASLWLEIFNEKLKEQRKVKLELTMNQMPSNGAN